MPPIIRVCMRSWPSATVSWGGSVAALAAGLTYLSVGSDIGGSIRNMGSRQDEDCFLRPSPGAVDTMRIHEVGLDAHIGECGNQHRTGLPMFCHMKSELRL